MRTEFPSSEKTTDTMPPKNWLKDIREKRKKEDFFKGKVDTASVTPHQIAPMKTFA